MKKSKTPQLAGQGFTNQQLDKSCNACIVSDSTPNSQALQQEFSTQCKNFSQLSDDELEAVANLLPVGEVDA
jgi:hypothetical protein